VQAMSGCITVPTLALMRFWLVVSFRWPLVGDILSGCLAVALGG